MKRIAFALVIFCAVLAYRFITPSTIQPAQQPAARAAADGTDAQALRAELGAATTDVLVARLRERVAQQPTSTALNSQLGWALVQQLRETADAGLYFGAEQAFDAALKTDATNIDAMLGHGALALSRHDFEQAITWGERAKVINPWRAQTYGVIADAQIETGQYADAIKTVQKMVDTRPDLSSYSRVSYVRELHGDVDGAIAMMRKAVEAGTPDHENTLWTLVQLGNLHFNAGQLSDAEASYKAALNSNPSYPYAQAGLAKLAAARGDYATATSSYVNLVERLPLPEFAIALGELYQVQGQNDKAKQQYDVVRAIMKLNAAGKQNVDMELALFEADHGDAQAALEHAQTAWQKRPSIHAADVLAWALHKNGRNSEAAKLSRDALKLGTRDAAMHYRAGMIRIAAGDAAAGQALLREALAINPAFSVLHAPEARKALGIGA
jgi:tetratricopeptide (TPR) repeat protein